MAFIRECGENDSILFEKRNILFRISRNFYHFQANFIHFIRKKESKMVRTSTFNLENCQDLQL